MMIVTGSSSGMLGRVMRSAQGGFMVMMQAFLWVLGVEWPGGHFVCTEKGHLWETM